MLIMKQYNGRYDHKGAEDNMNKKNNSKWMYISIAAIVLLITVSVLYFSKIAADSKSAQEVKSKKGSEILTLWDDGSPAKKELIDYVEAVTDEKSSDYIPVKNRIAVFDMDGTICSETNPTYFDYSLFMYRVLEDESYKDKASDFEKEVALRIYNSITGSGSSDGIPVDHGKCVASAFAGMSIDEFEEYVKNFRNMPAPGYTNMTRGESFYLPMLQVIEYLEANDFTVYIISGTDRFIVRGLIRDNEMLDLPMDQLIGSDETLVASGQNGEDGLKYQFTETDKLLLGGDFLIKNLKMNKVSVIEQEIGEQPVLSFGNSTGDQSMAEYVINNNKYRSLAFMVCCDDMTREYGNEESAAKMLSLCDQYGWTPISMKNDWKTIYGDDVIKTSDIKPMPFPIENLDYVSEEKEAA